MKKQAQKLRDVRDQLELLDDEFSDDVKEITDEAHSHIEKAICQLDMLSILSVKRTTRIKFNMLDFNSTDRNKTIRLKMYVPGINSGAYDKTLHIQAWITEKIKGIFTSNERKSYSDITLSRDNVKKLRNECSKILNLK